MMYDPACRESLIARIPLNLVLGFGWWLYWKMQNHEWNKELYNAYELGRHDEKKGKTRRILRDEMVSILREQQ